MIAKKREQFYVAKDSLASRPRFLFGAQFATANLRQAERAGPYARR